MTDPIAQHYADRTRFDRLVTLARQANPGKSDARIIAETAFGIIAMSAGFLIPGILVWSFMS